MKIKINEKLVLSLKFELYEFYVLQFLLLLYKIFEHNKAS